jgi:hypothetical protein
MLIAKARAGAAAAPITVEAPARAGADLKVTGRFRSSYLRSRETAENSDLLFSFSCCFCFLSCNNGRNTNAAGTCASPHMRGAFGEVVGGVTCECASRGAAIHAADAQGGWIC